MGWSGVRLVFGDNREMVQREWLEGLLRGLRQRVPAIWIESLSAAEVAAMARNSGLGLRETIARLQDAGLHSICGRWRGPE